MTDYLGSKASGREARPKLLILFNMVIVFCKTGLRRLCAGGALQVLARRATLVGSRLETRATARWKETLWISHCQHGRSSIETGCGLSWRSMCYPNVDTYNAQMEAFGANRWQVVPILEELKPLARKEGLWNLFMPPSKEHDTDGVSWCRVDQS